MSKVWINGKRIEAESTRKLIDVLRNDCHLKSVLLERRELYSVDSAFLAWRCVQKLFWILIYSLTVYRLQKQSVIISAGVQGIKRLLTLFLWQLQLHQIPEILQDPGRLL